jgi:hypothetical protein
VPWDGGAAGGSLSWPQAAPPTRPGTKNQAARRLTGQYHVKPLKLMITSFNIESCDIGKLKVITHLNDVIDGKENQMSNTVVLR